MYVPTSFAVLFTVPHCRRSHCTALLSLLCHIPGLVDFVVDTMVYTIKDMLDSRNAGS